MENNLRTPFFLYDRSILKKNIVRYSSRNFCFNYSVKSCSLPNVLQEIEPFVDGFTVTSVRDLSNARKLSGKKNIHYVSPMLRGLEIESINDEGDSISFNSIESLDRFRDSLEERIKIFVRINPELSFVDDERYNPCRNHSKLGVGLKDFIRYLDKNSTVSIYGIHFHTNCQSEKPDELVRTFEYVEKILKNHLMKFEEINMGGGYVYSDGLLETINQMQNKWHRKYGIVLRMEPSFDITNSAGFLCSSVVDTFNSQGKKIAILDTALNHLPEVFEYGGVPDVFVPQVKEGGHTYILAGSTCLAGDVFGEYSFSQPLKTGYPVIFKNVGAYSLVRANTFNGIPIPDAHIGRMDVIFNTDSKIKTISNPKGIFSDTLVDSLNA